MTGAAKGKPKSDEELGVSAKRFLWMICGVVLGVLPVGLSVFLPFLAVRGLDLVGPLSDGELLIASSAIAGGAIAELFGVDVKGVVFEVRVGGQARP